MKLFMCCLFLPVATMVVTAPVRARRENVLTFLNDALSSTTEQATAGLTTAYPKPQSKPEKEQDSADMSEEKSAERLDKNGFRDVLRDPDSRDIDVSEVRVKDKAPSGRTTGADKDNNRPAVRSSSLVWDQGSREHGGPHDAQQASREQADLNSEERVTVNAQRDQNLSEKQVVRLSRSHVSDRVGLSTDLQRRVSGLNDVLAPGRTREQLDWDSLEDNNGRPASVGNRGDPDYDETREFISSETRPVALPELMPGSVVVPAKSRAT